MDYATLDRLAAECAPRIHPRTVAAVVTRESRLNPLAIGINGRRFSLSAQPKTRRAAAAVAADLIRRGASVDLGLGQINSANLRRLGLTPADAFDPCKNLAAMQTILAEGFMRARATSRTDQQALAVAFSYYNTGRPDRGFRNGYVRAVFADAKRVPQSGRTK